MRRRAWAPAATSWARCSGCSSGAPFVHVPYRGAGPAVTDLAAGNVDLLFSSYVSAIGQVQGGKLRVLGWTATKRSPALPDVPTMAEAGYPGTELEIWQGIVAPLGTPPAIVRKLNEEFIKAAKSPEVVSKVAAQAVEMHHEHAGGLRQADRRPTSTVSAR